MPLAAISSLTASAAAKSFSFRAAALLSMALKTSASLSPDLQMSQHFTTHKPRGRLDTGVELEIVSIGRENEMASTPELAECKLALVTLVVRYVSRSFTFILKSPLKACQISGT